LAKISNWSKLHEKWLLTAIKYTTKDER